MTEREATESWVREFNRFPTSMITELAEHMECDWQELGDHTQYLERFPMWGTMWQFNDAIDNWWLAEDGGLEIMLALGFRLYESQSYGYFFGIDGAGFDFYKAYWIPLYRARGLQWHDE